MEENHWITMLYNIPLYEVSEELKDDKHDGKDKETV